MSDYERKFGKYAVRDLSLKLIILYLIGYVIYYIRPDILYYMTLNPYAIVHGQVWRLISWLLIPPSVSNLFFIAIMMFFYYSIGTSLERVWGTWRYNVFIFTGILLTIVSAFLWMGFTYLTGSGGALGQIGAVNYFGYYSAAFSTYYINMGIFFAYALTFPEAIVLLFFIIPVKVKWLGLLDVVYLLYEFVQGTGAMRFAIAATFVNIAILYLRSGRKLSGNFSGRSMEEIFHSAVGGQGAKKSRAAGPDRRQMRPSGGVVHRCAICGRTQADNPDLEFRYCSKCEGGQEYCQDHLFTHVHVKEGEKPHMQAPGGNN